MKLVGLLFVSGLALAGSSAFADPDPELGVSVRGVEAAEIIDPNPHYRGDPAPGSNGQRSVRALTRYKIDREKPLILPTSDTESGSQGVVVNGTGESENGTQVLSGDNASGAGTTQQKASGGVAPGASGSGATGTSPGGPASR